MKITFILSIFDINGQDGNTCLHLACLSNNPSIRIIDILTSYGLLISACNKAGLTPLMLAVYHAPAEFLNSFLSRDDVTIGVINLTDHCGCSALHHAAWSGRAKIVQLLLRHGIDSKLVDHYHRLACDLSVSNEIRELITNQVHSSEKKKTTTLQVSQEIQQNPNAEKVAASQTKQDTEYNYISFRELKMKTTTSSSSIIDIQHNYQHAPDDDDDDEEEVKMESMPILSIPYLNGSRNKLVSTHRIKPAAMSSSSMTPKPMMEPSLESILDPFDVNDWNKSFTEEKSNDIDPPLHGPSTNWLSSVIQKDFSSVQKRDDMMYYTKRKPGSVSTDDEKITKEPIAVDILTTSQSLPPIVSKYYIQPTNVLSSNSSAAVVVVGKMSRTTEKFLQKSHIQKLQPATVNQLNSKLFGTGTGSDEYQNTDNTDTTEQQACKRAIHSTQELESKSASVSVSKRNIKVFLRPTNSSVAKQNDTKMSIDTNTNLSIIASQLRTTSKISQTNGSDMTKIEKHLQRRQTQMLLRRSFELEVLSGFEEDE